MTFKGFSKETSDFLFELMFNNEREWFLTHKNNFEQYLNQPFKALAEEVTAKMNELYPNMQWQCHVSRIYRDARRLFGRGPYKERLWFSVYPAGVGNSGPNFWFEIGAAQYGYGFGYFDVTPAVMERFRRGIDANPARFERLAMSIEKLPGFEVIGPQYKRPKGERGELINKWYNRKWAGAEHMADLEGEAFTPELTDIITAAYKELMPMYEYFLEFYYGAGDFSGE